MTGKLIYYTLARIYLDKIIEITEWTLAFDENDEIIKKQLILWIVIH